MGSRLLVLLSLFSFLLAGCSGGGGGSNSNSAEESISSASGLTTFRIQLPPNSPRAIRGQTVQIDRIVLTVLQNETVVRRAETAVSAGQAFVELSVPSLNPGNYNVRVEGYQGNELLAADEKAATLSASAPTSVQLILQFIQPLLVTPLNFNLTPGATQLLTATRGGTPVTATFVSDDPLIASVSPTGTVTGQADGTTTIRVTENDETVLVTVTVSPVVVLNFITVTPADFNLEAGNTLNYTAIGNFSDSSTPDITTAVTWASSIPTIADIDGNGQATGLADGDTVITATLDGEVGFADLTVFTTPTLEDIEISPLNPTIVVAGTQSFMATGRFSDNSTVDLTGSVTWTSSVPGIAGIDNPSGVATGVSAGVTTITATDGVFTDSTSLTVTAAPTFVRLEVTPVDGIIPLGGTLDYTGTAVFSDNSTMDVTASTTWFSGSSTVASIDASTGVATGLVSGQFLGIQGTFMGSTDTVPVEVFGAPQPPGPTIATATDPSLTGEDILPDVAVSRSRVMVVKENRASVESHVLLQRFLAPPSPIFQFTNLTPTGSMVDFGGNGSITVGGTALPPRTDGEPSVDADLDGVDQAAVAYTDGAGNIRGRYFPFLTDPTGTGTDLSTGAAPSNPQISIASTTPNVIVNFAEDAGEFVADFSLNTLLTQVTTVTTSTSTANDIDGVSPINLSVRTWIDNSVAPSVIRYQLLNDNVPNGAIRTVQGTLGTNFEGNFTEVSCSMFFDGNFVIAFDEVIDPGTSFIHFAAFDGTGAQLYDAVTVASPDGINRVPDVSAAGGFVQSFYLVWKSYVDTADLDGRVAISRFRFLRGTPHPTSVNGPFGLSPANPPGSNLDPPAITTNEVGDSVVVWASKMGAAPSRVFVKPIPRLVNFNF